MARTVDLDCKYVTATEEAVCVKHEGVKFWLPKKAVQINEGAFEENEPNEGDDVSVTVPESMALEKGMI